MRRRGRQLQNRGALADEQIRNEHFLAIRKFKCVVMHADLILVDLAEPRDFVATRFS